ncbi:MAG: L,D-transpeptidase family protein [Pyrinomonadaceae bacterium]
MKAAFLIVVLGFTSAVVPGQIKKPLPPAVKIPFSESLQSVVVTTDSSSAIQGLARLYERRSTKSNWKSVGDEFRVVVGRNGLAWGEDSLRQSEKKEGDGKSPAGLFPLTTSFGRSDKAEGIALPYTKLGEYTECVDDTASWHYNKIVDRLKVGIFDWKSSEKMLEVGPAYDLGINVAYNSYPVVKGNGSCIFLHVWSDATTGTAGCTAMKREDLQKILAWAIPNKHPYLVQMTESDYKNLRKKWNLPKLK